MICTHISIPVPQFGLAKAREPPFSNEAQLKAGQAITLAMELPDS
ncbi:hypothetical protein VPMS16_3580 [Vibrio sp. 16]|nr:hypothetical protein VPMS16_3580 [Vibrio sp. 16]